MHIDNQRKRRVTERERERETTVNTAKRYTEKPRKTGAAPVEPMNE